MIEFWREGFARECNDDEHSRHVPPQHGSAAAWPAWPARPRRPQPLLSIPAPPAAAESDEILRCRLPTTCQEACHSGGGQGWARTGRLAAEGGRIGHILRRVRGHIGGCCLILWAGRDKGRAPPNCAGPMHAPRRLIEGVESPFQFDDAWGSTVRLCGTTK